jgi:alpha-glucosidase
VLSLYRRALGIRRTITGDLRWLESPDPDVLVFARGDAFICTVNVGTDQVDLDQPGRLVLASNGSSDLEWAGDRVKLPASTAAWWTTEAV